MPELPEVETVRRDLEKYLTGKKIVRIEVLSRGTVKNKLAEFERDLLNKKIVQVARRGKLLALGLNTKMALLVHLKMTGQLVYRRDRKIIPGGHPEPSPLQLPNKFTRVALSFSDRSQLFFNDVRRFGYMRVVSEAERKEIWENNFGIEPLTTGFKFDKFAELFKRRTNIKALLTNQKLVAGIGNIYVDEICFCAGILPWKKAGALNRTQARKLYDCVLSVLRRAVRNRGTTFHDFVDGDGQTGYHAKFLNVYDREGEKCKRCGGAIVKTRHAGRGTHYCPKCQR